MITGHVTPPGANLFADLGIEPVEAESLYVRTKLMIAITRIMRERDLKQRQAAALFGVSQPRISDIKRGKMESFTIDSLVDMLAHAGMRVKVTVVDIANEPATYAVESAPEEPAAACAQPTAGVPVSPGRNHFRGGGGHPASESAGLPESPWKRNAPDHQRDRERSIALPGRGSPAQDPTHGGG